MTLESADRIVGWTFEDLIDVPGLGGAGAFYEIPADSIGGGGLYAGKRPFVRR